MPQRRHRLYEHPFDLVSIDCLAAIGMDYWKIPSGEITNLPYLRKIGALGGKVIMSTGMSTLDEVEAAVQVLEKAGTPRSSVWLLHCTTQYPAPYESVNLRAMDALATLGCAGVGYSDHTCGTDVAVAAAGRGAVDYREALHPRPQSARPRPQGVARACRTRRTCAPRPHCRDRARLGRKKVADAESSNMEVARKSIVAACHIKRAKSLTTIILQ